MSLGRTVARRLVGRAERARHNDFDFACRHWWGDRNPAVDDAANRDFGGDPTRLGLRRCLVCRPYTREEADDLIAEDLAAVHLSV